MKNPLMDHCEAMYRKAVEAARSGNKYLARDYIFKGLESLKYLCDAEKVPHVRSVYENRAKKLLTIARMLREEGISERVKGIMGITGAAPTEENPPVRNDIHIAPPAAPVKPNTKDLIEKLREASSNKYFDPFAESEEENDDAQDDDIDDDELTEEEDSADIEEDVIVSDNDNEAEITENPVTEQVKPFDTIGKAMRPQSLKDYYGQPQTVAVLTDATAKARLSDSALAHVLLYGSHGLGKTTLAKILAAEMQTGFYEINNAGSLSADGMIDILKKLKKGDIVFIDEIHNLPSSVAEGVLYSAMEDFTVKYVSKKGKTVETCEIDLPPFTLVGATTESGKLLKPFKDRFGIECHLVPYNETILAMIAQNSFRKLGMTLSDELAMDIAKRARSTPRIVNRFVSRIADKAIVCAAAEMGLTEKGSLATPEKIKALNIEISKEVIDDYFKQNGIDELGLTDGDRTLLKLVVEKYNGGPVGLDSLAKAMNESQNVVADQYEAYLTKIGMLMTTSRGRMAMPAAYRYLGLAVPTHIREYFADTEADKVSETVEIITKSSLEQDGVEELPGEQTSEECPALDADKACKQTETPDLEEEIQTELTDCEDIEEDINAENEGTNETTEENNSEENNEEKGEE